MTKNKEILKNLASKEITSSVEKNRARIKNRLMLKESRKIALAVLLKLDELGWNQKTLAEKMEVSPQQVSKIVKGKENLTLQTIVALQSILDLPILASYFANNFVAKKEETVLMQEFDYSTFTTPFSAERNYKSKGLRITTRKKKYVHNQVSSTPSKPNHLIIA